MGEQVRVCSECGSTKRMVNRPEDSDLCSVCVGEERHPADAVAAARTQSRFHLMKGAYNEQPVGSRR